MEHEEDKVYKKKYGRNQTSAATATRTYKKVGRRDRCHRQIYDLIIKERCTCGLCLKGDYSNIRLNNKKCDLTQRNIARACSEYEIPTKTGLVGTWQGKQVSEILFDGKQTVPIVAPNIQPSSYNNSPVLWETIELTELNKNALGEVGKSFYTTTLTPDMDIDAFLTDFKLYIDNYLKNGVEVKLVSLPYFPDEGV